MKVVSLLFITVLLIFSGEAFAADGGKIFKEKCSLCHGPQGEGTPLGPSLKGNEFISKGKAEDISKVILEGRTGPAKKYPKIVIDMPKIPMPDADVNALVTHLKGDLQK